MASPQPVAAPKPEEQLETTRPSPQPETKETPFVIKLNQAIPV
jgi:hypothetical protein